MICLIPARKGSQRIPNKNILPFHGKPIIAYSIEAAKESELFSQIVVSTDDEEAIKIARGYGVDFHVRSEELCGSDPEIGTVAVVQDYVRPMASVFENEALCALYPCAPMVTGQDLIDSLNLYLIAAVPESLPYLYVTDGVTDIDQGQFYWGMEKYWKRGIPIVHQHSVVYPMPMAIDINTPADWANAKDIYEECYL